MATVHKSIRLDADLMGRVQAHADTHGMRFSEAVASLLDRGLSAVSEGTTQAAERPTEGRQDGERAETHTEDLRAVCEVLRASNADLRAEVSHLWAQLATKDEQITAAQSLADHAQQLHAAEVTRALPAEGVETKTLRQRLAAIFGRRGE